jgi:hypothetical protein
MSPQPSPHPSRVVVSLVEWVLKKVEGPDGWRPAGAVRVLPPSALVYDAQEAPRAEAVFQHLARLGFQPTKVPLDSLADDLAGTCRTIVGGAAGCWAVVVLEPEDGARAGKLGPAFREFAHRTPAVVAVVVGPLPSRSEILDRFRHVVMASDGNVSASDLAAGLAHASSARVLHCTRVLNVAVLLFALLALAVGVGLAGLAWAWRR